MDEIRDVRSEIEDAMLNNLKDIANYSHGSKERQSAMNELSTLGRIRVEEFKAEAEQLNTEQKLEMEKQKMEVEAEQREEEKKRFWITSGLGAAGLALNLGTAAVYMRRILKIEETGVVTSKALPALKDLLKNIRFK